MTASTKKMKLRIKLVLSVNVSTDASMYYHLRVSTSVLITIHKRMKRSNQAELHMFKPHCRNLRSPFSILTLRGVSFIHFFFIYSQFFYLSVSKNCLPIFSFSYLKVLTMTPMIKFIMKKLKMTTINTKYSIHQLLLFSLGD